MSSPRTLDAEAPVLAGDGLQEGLGPDDFDGLLHPSLMDTLVDFDFSFPDISGVSGTEAVQQQQQRQPLTSSPKLSGRKRSISQAYNWDNLGPKALSEISASVLAGGWESTSTGPQFSTSPATTTAETAQCPDPNSTSATPLASCPSSSRDVAPAQAQAVAPKQELQDPRGRLAEEQEKGQGRSKGRRAATPGGSKAGAGACVVGGKKPLTPDRMERKASREKRRREEVNEKFDQLLQVLEDAEATSGLEPPAAKEGKTGAHACINGRRVEVLSRTIQVLKKLLKERRDSLAGLSAAGAGALANVGAAACQEVENEGLVSHSLRSVVDEESPGLVAAGAAAAPAAPTVSGSYGSAAVTPPVAANDVDGCNPHVQEAHTRAGAVAAAREKEATNPHALMHHMAMSMTGPHHAPMVLPPGFAGMPGQPVPGPNGMLGHPGRPIFIAVPMYMPPGQGMPASAALENVSQASTAVASSLPTIPAAAADPSPATVATSPGGVEKVEPVVAPLGKQAWAMPHGMAHQWTMALQMPQFVTKALSAEEGDEEPTHAVCA